MHSVPKVKTFPQLIRWIADQYHDGAVLPIATRVGVSPALVGLWSRGQTAEPRVSNLQRLAEVYQLDFIWLLGLVHGKRLAPIAGGSGATAMPPVAPSAPLVADGTSGPQPLAKCPPIRDIMSRLRAITHRRWELSRTWAPMELAA